MTPEPRCAARIIIRDERGRVLLFQHMGSTGVPFWAPPGGGLESGETFEEAALRESSEELGINGVIPCFLWESVAEFVYIDRPVRQLERFFLIEASIPDFSAEVIKVHEREGITQSRWWSIVELQTARELIFPEELAAKLLEFSN